MTERALILAPEEQAAPIAAALHAHLGVEAVLPAGLAAFVLGLGSGVGLAVVDEAVLHEAEAAPLLAALAAQPAASEIPILVLVDRERAPDHEVPLAALLDRLGHAVPVERPWSTSTLVAIARAALRLRQREIDARAERSAMAASAAALDFALDAGRIGAWEFEPGESSLRASNRFKAIFGRPPDEAFGHADMLASIHPEDRDGVPGAITAALEGGAAYEVDCRVVWPDGSTRHVEIRGRVLEAPGGGRVLSGVLFDVTDRARSREDLARLVAERTAELEAVMAQRERAEAALRQSQKMEAVGQLTGGIAHDFNNLLQVVSSGLQLLEKPGSEERRARLLGAMRQATDRGAQLTRQLLAFSRRQELRPEVVDLGAQLAGMREMLERSLRGDIRITFSAAADLWPVEVDPTQFELAVLNVAVNARDAMPGGGVLSLTAHNVGGWREGALSGDFVRLALEDTGVGMAPETLTRVFEPFFTTKEVGSGSGLGLPQVYGFAAQSHGAVRIESVPGEGTTVSIMLPRARFGVLAATARPSLEAEPPEETMAPAAPGTTVLLVEDDDRVAELAAEMLLQLGYGFTRVRTGPAALGVLGNGQRIDLVFSDILMPGGMNGAELAEEIRRRRPGLPILLATGFEDQAIAEARASDLPLLRKPYELWTLGQALRVVLSRPDAGDTAASIPT